MERGKLWHAKEKGEIPTEGYILYAPRPDHPGKRFSAANQSGQARFKAKLRILISF